MRIHLLGVLLMAVSTACGGESNPTTSASSTGTVGAPPSGCAPGELTMADGSCEPAGVLPSDCAPGFMPSDDGGCDALLPAAACPFGQMALPGETACRDIAPCGTASYDGIPIDATTQFVDASFVGISDGTQAKPWTKIQDALDHVSPGGLIAVAAGTYAEDIDIWTKPVRLWGRCPSKVTIVGSSAAPAALLIEQKVASKTEIHRIAVTGPAIGVATTNTAGVELTEIWIHDTASFGFDVDDIGGTSAATLTSSLIENATQAGVISYAAAPTIVDSTIRGTRTLGGQHGDGIWVQPDHGTPAEVVLRNSVLELNHASGITALGSSATIDATVVRDTQMATGQWGRGVAIQADVDAGNMRASATIHASVIERNHSVGIVVIGADATIDATSVRDVEPDQSTAPLGYGMLAQAVDQTVRAKLDVSACLIERTQGVALGAIGSDATLERILVRDTTANPGGYGYGIATQLALDTGALGSISARASVVEQTQGIAVGVLSTSATLDGVAIRGSKPLPNGTYGDGIDVSAPKGPAQLILTNSLVEGAARAGLASFGATATIGGTHFECDAIALDGEGAYQLEDHGGTSCGCMGAAANCQVLTSNLVAPSPLAPSQ